MINELKDIQTLRIRTEEDVCFIQIYRPEANNTINSSLINEFEKVLSYCESFAKIVVLEGLPDVFCFGADFKEIQNYNSAESEDLYNIWNKLASGNFISIAHICGKTNAGGVGFAAACDLVLCNENAVFSLSELLFGLMPACVMPFLIRRIGFSKANFMTLMTQPISSKQALDWGLVDAYESNSESLLRKNLLRLKRLTKVGISNYKLYMNTLNNSIEKNKYNALDANQRVFTDPLNLEKIHRYIATGMFPWE